jgi:LysM domain
MTHYRKLHGTLQLSLLAILVACFTTTRADAFTHIVKPGETLAQIAMRVYGDAKLEVVLAGANALDSQGGSAPVPGMRLEVPAPGFHRVTAGETWSDLALAWLGDSKRADVLARVNNAVAWIAPVDGLEIQIPFVLTFIAGDNDRVDAVALRYLGDSNRAWEIDAYNGRKISPQVKDPLALKRGDVVLVALLALRLTDEGKAEARRGLERGKVEGSSMTLDAQRRADSELPLLLTDVRGGRYLDAVTRGNRVLGSGDLTKAQLATLHRALLEAYVALDASGAAAGACAAWRTSDPSGKLDPVLVSPKIRAACPR